MEWYLSNKTIFVNSSPLMNIFTNIKFNKIADNAYMFCDGYIIPRMTLNSDIIKLNVKDLIAKLYYLYNIDLIKHIKGSFILILFINNKIIIYNDHHSLSKYYIYRKGCDFIVTNNLKLISQAYPLTPSNENMAIYCLLEHFVNGMTLFKEVTFSKPASKLIIDDNGIISFDNYWHPTELLNKEISCYPFDYMVSNWRDIIKGYLENLNPTEVTMTLTGGNDSRMVLAGLLANNVKPNAFTFGNPKSFDGVVAKEIANRIELNYNNYFVNKPSSEWFGSMGDNIIKKGNTLINIHRAHRLYAVECETITNKKVEMLFGGFMGGDYTKGIIYDDYITAKLLRIWKYSAKNDADKVKDILLESHFNLELLDLESIIHQLRDIPYLNHKYKNIDREFLYLFYVIGSMHDWQDTNIFSSKIRYVVNPFMDIDFMELLFSSNHSMFNKNNSEDNIIKKFNYPALAVNTSHLLAPELSNIKYAKQGYYTNEDYLGYKPNYIIKRILRYRSTKSYPQNFPYGEWTGDYVNNILFNENLRIDNIFNISELQKEFNNSFHQTTERYWHKYTNPINIGLNLKEYLK